MTTEIMPLPEGEMWRILPIVPELRIARPDDWFSPDEYVACRIWEIWTAARVIEFGGGSPRVFMICVNQGKRLCRPHDGCVSECGDRFWANVSQGDVLGKKDLLRILASPEPLDPTDPRRELVSCQEAHELFGMIEQLEARQNC